MMSNDWITSLPKVELHLHLEGAIPLPALWELLEKYGDKKQFRNISELEARFQYRDFPHFIETWMWKNGYLREYEDFTHIADAVAQDLAVQGIRYVEAFYSPPDFEMHGLEPQRLTEAIRNGLRAHEDGVLVNLVADLVRDYGPKRGQRTLHALTEVRDLGVIGIGIGGSEQDFPPEPYQEVYEDARQRGFKTSAHAGEAAGSDSVWGAIRALKVDRIGHGARATEDPRLVEYLKEQQMPIEMCPISNLRTGVVDSLDEHPVKEFFEEGLLVTVNTDDPKMFNTSLEAEYTALIDQLGFERSDIIQLVENAIHSAWCNDSVKTQLRNELNAVA